MLRLTLVHRMGRVMLFLSARDGVRSFLQLLLEIVLVARQFATISRYAGVIGRHFVDGSDVLGIATGNGGLLASANGSLSRLVH